MDYDFLIVGGGIAGVSATYELAVRGTVLLLKAEDRTRYHATGRSAALFKRNYGGAFVRRVNAASAWFVRASLGGFCPTPLLNPRGCLTGAHDAASLDLETLLNMSELGEDVVPIDPDAACAMVPIMRLNRLKHTVYEVNVTDIDVATPCTYPILKTRSTTGWTVQTAHDGFSAVHVVNATGAWAGQIRVMAGHGRLGWFRQLLSAPRPALTARHCLQWISPDRTDISNLTEAD